MEIIKSLIKNLNRFYPKKLKKRNYEAIIERLSRRKDLSIISQNFDLWRIISYLNDDNYITKQNCPKSKRLISKYVKISFKNWAYPIIIPKYKKKIDNTILLFLENEFYNIYKRKYSYINIIDKYDLDKNLN